MSSKRLKIMHLKGKLLSLKQVHIDMCESYIHGKKNVVSFKKVGITPKEAKLKLVHTYVRVIDLILAISGRSYFVILTYDHLRKVWVYLMR